MLRTSSYNLPVRVTIGVIRVFDIYPCNIFKFLPESLFEDKVFKNYKKIGNFDNFALKFFFDKIFENKFLNNFFKKTSKLSKKKMSDLKFYVP